MNKRIKELLEQAGVKFVVMPKDTEYEKFAELIIRECLSYTKDGDIDFMKFMIKQNFGVEA